MKINIRVMLVFSALTLSGCQTLVDPTIVDKAQDAAEDVCNFVPTAKTILGLLNAGLGAAAEIADTICKLIPKDPPKAGERRAPVVFKDVPIEGRYVPPTARRVGG